MLSRRHPISIRIANEASQTGNTNIDLNPARQPPTLPARGRRGKSFALLSQDKNLRLCGRLEECFVDFVWTTNHVTMSCSRRSTQANTRKPSRKCGEGRITIAPQTECRRLLHRELLAPCAPIFPRVGLGASLRLCGHTPSGPEGVGFRGLIRLER